MGSTKLGDIPSGAIAGQTISHASVASNGANAAILAIGVGNWRAPQNVTIVSAHWEPTGADSAVTNTTSYRTLTLINGGSAGTGTAVLASVALTATTASNTLRALTLASVPTVAEGSVVAFSHATVGGAETNGTVLVAGQARFSYRPI
jgi:hypothetical protein